ncbi:MAG: hypothetical protein CMD16_03825 [Flavobacteriales bacterium]|nr:hypothetical protein [Flavobacteriales bacterium]|tara:strand:- start:6178 stop:7329 length:1152 start_codon:yes stop_codon:yes gene_type:complete
MKICIVSSSFFPATFYGGPISSTWGISRQIVRNGIKVYVSTTNANGKEKLDIKTNEYIKKEGVFIKYYREEIINRFSLSFILGIYSDIKKADVVYIQYLFHYTVLFSLIYSVFLNKKIILCARGSLSGFTLSNQHKLLKLVWLRLFIRPFSRKIIWQASSYLEKEDIKRRFPNAIVEVIPDGVDFSSFQNSKIISKEDMFFRYTSKRVNNLSSIFFSMGRLHEIKGFDVLIDAFSLYLNKDQAAKLIIAGGDDGFRSKLESQIEDLRVQESVFLIGEVSFDDKKVLLNNCDYFTLASRFESFGIVIAEALSCGKPIILSNKTPWHDLEENKCGILADNNKSSFSYAFTRIVHEKYDSKEIRKYVRSNYDWKVIVGRFIKILRS